MKKARRILCLMAALVLCISLCGCVDLDELRAMRATMTEEGNVKLADGTEYKLLPECEELSPKFEEYLSVYITQEDLPLLLTTTSENYLDKSDDGLFLQTYFEEDGYYKYIYYCRTDIYDSVVDRIENGFTPDYCFYWYYTDTQMTYTLTQQQWDAVEQVYTTQEPKELPAAAAMEWEHCASLILCSADGLFQKGMVDVCVYDGKYHLDAYDGEHYLVYEVPSELNSTFEKILEKQVESDLSWEEW